MDYSHIGGGDQFSWSAILLMAFALFGAAIMPWFLILVVLIPAWFVGKVIYLFVKGWMEKE